MKNGVVAVLVVGALLSSSGSTLAAGKMGGASGIDAVGRDRPVYAGKLGGAGGADEFLLAASGFDVMGKTRLLAGKLGGAGGMDEFVQSDPDEVPGSAVQKVREAAT